MSPVDPISVDIARQHVRQQCRPLGAVRLPLSECLGLALAEDVASDVDSPPHDKAMVDGYAVLAADLSGGSADLNILEEITAGKVPQQAIHSGHATRIMTGAPVPDGADAVVMIEQTRLVDGAAGSLGRVRIESTGVSPRQNIMAQGTVVRAGAKLIAAGHTLRPIEIGVSAEAGRATLAVHRRPRVAVLATGDELVDVSTEPGPGQIRNSNGPMLLALARRHGAEVQDLGIARDNEADLTAKITRGLQADVLILSGGVSAGVRDLVPQVLSKLGVAEVFHKVRLKPGKPLWFGMRPATAAGDSSSEAAKPSTLVFGLPGNPVSSFVCCELFVREAIALLGGHRAAQLPVIRGTLRAPYQHRGDRPTYHPALVDLTAEPAEVTPIDWRGSADMVSLVAAGALAAFPAGNRHFAPGEAIDAWLL